MSDFNFTTLELTVVNALVNNFAPVDKRIRGNGGYSFFDGGLSADNSGTWAYCLIEESGNPKTYRGVISSLVKKGFLASYRTEDGVWIDLTEDSVQYLKDAIAAL